MDLFLNKYDWNWQPVKYIYSAINMKDWSGTKTNNRAKGQNVCPKW